MTIEKHNVTLGMTVYNGENFLRQAIESILNQTYRDFVLYVIDDFSTDSSWQIIRQYEQADHRIKAKRNEARLGAVATWRAVCSRALEHNTTFYAWLSDHDIWDPQWLQVLVSEAIKNPEFALTYCKSHRIDQNGFWLRRSSSAYTSTSGNRIVRIAELAYRGQGYGDMIYGLFRANALRKTSIYRALLLPDTVTIWEIALYGGIHQVQRDLWSRRFDEPFSVQRQRKMLFTRPPWYTYVPYWLGNSLAIMAQRTDSHKQIYPAKKLSLGLRTYLAVCYAIAFAATEIRRRCAFIKHRLGKSK